MSSKFKLFIVSFLLINSLVAQETSYTNVSGIVMDTLYRPLEYVAVQFHSKQDTTMTYGAMTSVDGTYSIKNIPLGKYEIAASSLGYQTVKKEIELKSNRKNTKLGLIQLKEALYELDEIEITVTKNKIKERIDKTIFVPDSIMLRSAKTGIDVLKKIPEVRVKNDQSISVQGNKNVLVLINGMNHERSILSINPNDIKEIELITHPSVKYQSDVASVINIITKDYKQKGLSLNTNIYYCLDRKRHSGNIQLDYNVGKWNFFISYYGNYNLQKSRDSLFREDTSEGNTHTINSYPISDNSSDITLNKIQYGFDYNINPKNTISFTSRINQLNLESNRNYTTLQSDNNLLNRQSDILSKYDSDRTGQNYSLFFKHKFKNDKENITINTNYYILNTNSKHQVKDSTWLYTPEEAYANSRTINTLIQQRSLNTIIDYTKPFSEKFILESGYQFYHREITDKREVVDVEQSNLSYTDYRNAGYANLTYLKNKWNYQLGLRLENFDIDVNEVKHNQTKLLPYGAVFYVLNSKNSLKLTYRKSLEYPTYSTLNPFKYYASDSLSYFSGNPYLKPEQKNNLNLKYTYKKKHIYLSAGFSYNRLSDMIVQNVTSQDNVLAYSYDNIGNANQFEALLSLSIIFFGWLEIELMLKGGYTDYLTKTTHSGYYYIADFGVYFPIFWDIDVEMYGLIKEREIHYNGYNEYGGYIDEILLSKNIIDNLILGIAVWEPFIKVNDKDITWGDTFSQTNHYTQLQSPSYMLNLTYFLRTGKKNKKVEKESLMEEVKDKGKKVK
jgi:hypothetical protein